MPLYEFRCKDCAETFELRRGFDEADAPAACPGCGQANTVRLFGMPAVFSGSGESRRAIAGSGGCGPCASAGSSACSSCSVKR